MGVRVNASDALYLFRRKIGRIKAIIRGEGIHAHSGARSLMDFHGSLRLTLGIAAIHTLARPRPDVCQPEDLWTALTLKNSPFPRSTARPGAWFGTTGALSVLS